MKKRRVEVIAILLCIAAIIMNFTGGTNAFFAYEEKAHNVITTGAVAIELIEMMDPENDGELVPFEDQDGVMPGADVSKIVTIKNSGEQPAYVRIKVEKSFILSNGTSENIDLSLASCDINTKDWTEKDGYYYYNTALEVGNETEPLFTTVTLAEEMGNMYQNSKLIIDVSAQATQVANNGTHALEALGWPEE